MFRDKLTNSNFEQLQNTPEGAETIADLS